MSLGIWTKWRRNFTLRVGNGESSIRQSRNVRKVSRKFGGSGHRRARVHLHQRLLGHLQDLRVAQASPQSPDRTVRQFFFTQTSFFQSDNVILSKNDNTVRATLGESFIQSISHLYFNPLSLSHEMFYAKSFIRPRPWWPFRPLLIAYEPF